jgi:Ca2+-transporting ATPase
MGCPRRTPEPGWLRFLDRYRCYMQLILVGAAVVSLVIKEWSTGVLLLILTLPRLIRPGQPP